MPTQDYRYLLPNPEARCPTEYPRRRVNQPPSPERSNSIGRPAAELLDGEEFLPDLLDSELLIEYLAESFALELGANP